MKNIRKQIEKDAEKRGLVARLTEKFCADYNNASYATGSPCRIYHQDSAWLFADKSLAELRKYAKRWGCLENIRNKYLSA